MMDKKILICDDSVQFGRSLMDNIERITAVQEHFDEIRLVSPNELSAAIGALEQRLKIASRGEITEYPNDEANIIDEADLLVIDYALLDLDKNESATGERVAYLARCYSKCGIIVALNQYPPYVEESFDLTLRGHLESYADLNLPSNSLFNPGLWSEPWSGFRPWSWPLMPLAIDKYERRVGEVRHQLNGKILEYLGFEGSKALALPRAMVEFLSRSSPDEMTFAKFVDSNGSGNGLRGRHENPINNDAVARIAAARIGNWLEQSVLPGQDILVDAPHLVSRFPSILGEHSQDIEAWNRTASFDLPQYLGMEPMIDGSIFPKEDWVFRPAWFWNDLRDNENIEEVKNPWAIRRPDRVFCEDISKFEKRENAREFVADLNSPYSRRYVKFLDVIGNYSPIVRFSL